MLISSELHLNPYKLTEKEFIEQSRNVLWLMNYKEERQTKVLKEAMLEAYVEVMQAQNG